MQRDWQFVINFVRNVLKRGRAKDSGVPKDLQRAFRLYNRKYFNNELPNDTQLSWEKLPGDYMGYQADDEIVMSRAYRSKEALWRSTLLHEMCHLKLPNAGHGPKFQSEMLRLAKLGAFKGLW